MVGVPAFFRNCHADLTNKRVNFQQTIKWIIVLFFDVAWVEHKSCRTI